MSLSQHEKVIDVWTILYRTPTGYEYNGKLTVTNKRLLYDATSDISAKDLRKEALFAKLASEDFIVIPKESIREIEVSRKFFSKKVILTLDNGSKHTFNYGLLNVDLLVNAIMRDHDFSYVIY